MKSRFAANSRAGVMDRRRAAVTHVDNSARVQAFAFRNLNKPPAHNRELIDYFCKEH